MYIRCKRHNSLTPKHKTIRSKTDIFESICYVKLPGWRRGLESLSETSIFIKVTLNIEKKRKKRRHIIITTNVHNAVVEIFCLRRNFTLVSLIKLSLFSIMVSCLMILFIYVVHLSSDIYDIGLKLNNIYESMRYYLSSVYWNIKESLLSLIEIKFSSRQNQKEQIRQL